MSYIQPLSARPLAWLTLSDISDAIRHDLHLQLPRRQDMLSALNTAAAVLERDLADIEADLPLLRRRLAEASPVKRQITAGRWHNVRSLVGQAVARVVPTHPSRQTGKLDPAWRALANTMKELCKKRVRTSGFMHFCSARAIRPEAVDQAVFDAFEQALLARSLRKDPAGAYRDTVSAWNKAVRTLPGWPAFQAVRPSRRKTWTRPWREFPALCVNKQPWLHRLGDEDPVNGLPFKPLRPSTLKALDHMLLESASALALVGWDPARFCEVRHFGTLEAFKAVLREMIKQRGGFAGGHIVHVAWMLKAIARHVTQAPQAELDEMGAVIRRLQAKQQTGMTETNRNRLRPFDDPEIVKIFLDLPDRLLREAHRVRAYPKVAAALVEMAVAIALLLMAPMRIRNLVGLDLKQHIIRLSAGKHVWIHVPQDEVKNEVTLDYPLPDETVALLDTYLRDHRPHLITTPTTALFPGMKGFRSSNGFGAKIKKTIKKYTGLTINPHLFRHIGAKLYLDGNPGGYEVVRRVLAHSSSGVTTSFYTGMETAAAIRHYQASILSRRGTGGLS